jgi:integral membrane sensor domain MASE1
MGDRASRRLRAAVHRVRQGGLRTHGAPALRIVAVALAYYGSAELGLLQHLVRGQVTPLWPPTGIALAALLLLGLRAWPGIALGAFLTNVTLGPSPAAVLGITVGNTLAPVTSYLLLRRLGFRPQLDRLRDALTLVFLGALTGMLVSATIGSGALALSGVLGSGWFWSTWSVWWTGDAMGVLVVTPVILALRTVRLPSGIRGIRAMREIPGNRGIPGAGHGISAWRWAEAGALLLGTVAVVVPATQEASLLFLVFPLLIWAAFRFQLAGAASCALVVSTLAIHAAADRTGPFAGHGLLSNMVTLQAFNGSAALTALLLSAAVTQRDVTHQEIQRACDQLADMVTHLKASERPFPLPPADPQRQR